MKCQANKNKNATLERTSTYFFKAEARTAKFQENIKVGFLPSKLLEWKMAMGIFALVFPSNLVEKLIKL